MRHIYHYEGRQFVADSEIVFTHVVLGQRDAKKDEPTFPLYGEDGKPYPVTNEQRAQRAKFVFDSTHGWYAVKALGWASSAEEAAATAQKFTADGWINVEVKPVDPRYVITHG